MVPSLMALYIVWASANTSQMFHVKGELPDGMLQNAIAGFAKCKRLWARELRLQFILQRVATVVLDRMLATCPGSDLARHQHHCRGQNGLRNVYALVLRQAIPSGAPP